LPLSWRAATAGIDLLTAACAALNLVYFSCRFSGRLPAPAGRRPAALVLAAVSFAAFVEAVALLAAGAQAAAVLGSGEWTLVRLLGLAGASGTSALVLRRLLAR
jgi:hypothetical protein